MLSMKEKSRQVVRNLESELGKGFSNKTLFGEWVTDTLKFPKYSGTNRDILWSKRASLVATYKQWESMGIKVVEKGAIQLLQPNQLTGILRVAPDGTKEFVTLGKMTDQEKTDLAAGKLKKQTRFCGFRCFNVFDVSKTNASKEQIEELAAKKLEKKNLEVAEFRELLGEYYSEAVPKDKTLQEYLKNKILADIIEQKYDFANNEAVASLSACYILERFGLPDQYVLSKASTLTNISKISRDVHTYAESMANELSMYLD